MAAEFTHFVTLLLNLAIAEQSHLRFALGQSIRVKVQANHASQTFETLFLRLLFLVHLARKKAVRLWGFGLLSVSGPNGEPYRNHGHL